MTPRTMALWAAVLGLCGVAFGAFGAHALRARVPAADLEIWRTGVHYLQVHALALLALAAWARGRPTPDPLLPLSARAFAVGAVLFFGTLAGMVLGGPRWLGAITPLGGLSLLLGWGALAVAAWRGHAPRTPRSSVGPGGADRP